MIIGKKTMRHTAAGLLGSFISRNNNIERLWALGVLYTEAQAAANRVELDLLLGQAIPDAPACSSVARTYAAYLRTALRKHGFPAEALSSATVSIAFGLMPVPKCPGDDSFGAPFNCSVTMVSSEGVTVSRQVSGHCAPHLSRLFAGTMAMREAGFRLLRAITQRSTDCAGRWSLEVLRDANPGEYEVELDLLHERAAPASQANAMVAGIYAGMLREQLGALMPEWMQERGAATVRVRFSLSSANPLGSAYVETRLVAPEGHAVWFNTYLALKAPPPWEQVA